MVMTKSLTAMFGHIQINTWYYFANDTLILKISLASFPSEIKEHV